MIEGYLCFGQTCYGRLLFLVWKSIWNSLPEKSGLWLRFGIFGSTMTFEVPTCTFVGWEYRSVRQRAGLEYLDFLPLFFFFGSVWPLLFFELGPVSTGTIKYNYYEINSRVPPNSCCLVSSRVSRFIKAETCAIRVLVSLSDGVHTQDMAQRSRRPIYKYHIFLHRGWSHKGLLRYDGASALGPPHLIQLFTGPICQVARLGYSHL